MARSCKNHSAAEDPGFCLVKASLAQDSKAAKTLQCIESVQGQTKSLIASCAVTLIPQQQQAEIACFQNNTKNYKALALCASGTALPPTAQKLIDCASHLKKTTASYKQTALCVGAAEGSREAQCLIQHKDDWPNAALCMGGNQVPQQVQSALRCAEHSDSYGSFGVCMVAAEGAGEAQRIAECYVEGQGIPAAVAVCLAAPFLTTDQRIALECAAETNGALPATAACTGGRMAMKEMLNCQGHHFAEGNCFSESNELRKLAKTLGMEIGPHSVVADVVNIQLQITAATTTPVLNVATQVITPLIKIGTDLNMIPNKDHPVSFILPGPVPQKIVEGIGNFCDHNPCPKICLFC